MEVNRPNPNGGVSVLISDRLLLRTQQKNCRLEQISKLSRSQ